MIAGAAGVGTSGPKMIRKEASMGALKDRAKAQSKFLLLDVGENAIVQYVGWKPAADPRDPTKEVTIFEFRLNGVQKFWTNSSAKIMMALDSANSGDYVRISREAMLNAAGVAVPGKTVWSAELLPGYDPRTGQTMASNANVAPQAIQGPAKDVLAEADAHLNQDPGEEIDPFATE